MCHMSQNSHQVRHTLYVQNRDAGLKMLLLFNPSDIEIRLQRLATNCTKQLCLEILYSGKVKWYSCLIFPFQQVANVLWWYCFSKVIEFLDTILMVLRKKQSQVTVLHVFHHASILHISWWLVTFMPGGQSEYIAVHL